MPQRRFAPCLALASVLAAGPASARVVFTGYADFRLTPESTLTFSVPAAVAAKLGIESGRYESRTASFDGVGLFATTSLSDQARFLVDFTYRDISYATAITRLQYAYLEYAPLPGLAVQAGKVMLPFGYLNQNRFYSFQRSSVSPPTFQSGIVGLPIADLGVEAEQALAAGPVQVRIAGYAVNGYGPRPGSTSDFRAASLTGSLTIANNLGSRDANKKVAGGGRVAASLASVPGTEVGVSYYGGQWDPAGRQLFQMGNAHVVAEVAKVAVHGEYLHLDADGDQGMVPPFGNDHWRTDGFFATVEYRGLAALDRQLIPWARVEDYRSRGFGGAGREILRSYAGGAAWQALESVVVKAEVNDLVYHVPFPTPAEELGIDGISYVLGMSISF